MNRFKNILVYVGSNQNDAAINRAVELAAENGASLTLMDVIKPVPKSIGLITDVAKPGEIQQLVTEEHRKDLMQSASEYIDTGVHLDVVVSVGDTASEIVRQVVSGGHDLVLKTADGSSVSKQLFGTVARSLLRMCPCPVWILKPAVHGPFDRVLAAIDVDATDDEHLQLNQEILELAYSVSQAEDAELHLVAAWDFWMEGPLRRRAGDDEINRALASKEAEVRKALDLLLQAPNASQSNIHVHLKHGVAARVILSVAEEVEADLLVMGTVCRTGVTGLLMGNTAEAVLADADCSVLALKPKEFVSPVVREDGDEGVFDPPNPPETMGLNL